MSVDGRNLIPGLRCQNSQNTNIIISVTSYLDTERAEVVLSHARIRGTVLGGEAQRGGQQEGRGYRG